MRGRWLADSHRRHAVLLAVNLVPFAGIAFLWFIGSPRPPGRPRGSLLRHRVPGQRAAVRGHAVRGGGCGRKPRHGFDGGVGGGRRGADWRFGGSLTHALLTTYGMRMAAVFMITTTTITLRYGVIPRWLGIAGYASALALLLGVNVVGWLELLFPLFVFAVSVHLLTESFRGEPPP